jgi:triacylglycerol esterase/lipase EstA (alpha/beta hydrolase family)
MAAWPARQPQRDNAQQGWGVRLARLLQAVVAVLLLAAALWAAFWWQRGQPLWAVLGAVLILFLHAPVMALEFAFLRRANRDERVPRPSTPELLRAWAHEVLAAVQVFAWRQPFRWRRFDDQLSAAAPGRRGLLLVHGFVCNRGLWNPWWPRLQQQGVPCIALNLEPVFGSIDAYAPLIDAAVQRLAQATGQAPLLVAHSMGGLAVRAWLRDGAGEARIHGVVTVGSPHNGTWLGRFGRSRNARQMRAHSAWLSQLAQHETAARYRLFTCFYSHCDNVVFPCSTATLPGADNRHLRGQAHVQLLQHPAVFDEVLRRLQEDVAPQPGENSRSPDSTVPASICGQARTSA